MVATAATRMDRQLCRALMERLEAEAIRIGRELGLSTVPVRASFTHTDCTVKVTFACTVAGEVQTPHVQAFTQLAGQFGFQPAHLHATFESRGMVYEITGLRPAAHKRPIVAKNRANGKEYVFDAPTVLRALGLPVPGWLLPRPWNQQDLDREAQREAAWEAKVS